MVRPTHEEIIRGLTADVTLLKERQESIREELAILTNLQVRVALLEQRVADMREGSQQWVQRAWMILAPLISAIIGAAVVYYAGWKR
jgi:hypothetical protein